MDVQLQKSFAQAIAKAAREHDVHMVDITFSLPGPGCFEQTRMIYSSGRHSSAGSLKLIVTTHIGDFPEEHPP